MFSNNCLYNVFDWLFFEFWRCDQMDSVLCDLYVSIAEEKYTLNVSVRFCPFLCEYAFFIVTYLHHAMFSIHI